jgi:hypothetical protein
MKVGWIIIPVLFGAFVLSSPGTAGAVVGKHAEKKDSMAASVNERCTYLEQQFDKAIKKTPNGSAQMVDAQALRDEGANLCAGDNPQRGIADLEAALHELSANPRS